MSHATDAFEWDNIFLSKTFDYDNNDSARAWGLLNSLLALGLVNKLWRRAFQLRIFPSSWAVIPASLSDNWTAIRTCICLSRTLPLTITLRLHVRLDSRSRRRDDQYFSMFEPAANRIASVRTSIISPLHFYELVRRRTLVGQWQLISSATTLEVHASQVSKKSPLWLRTPPSHLTTLSLTNFTFTRLCALPATLTSLSLNFTPPPHNWSESILGRPMGLDDLTGTLSRLPLLEILNVDVRYMAQALMSQVNLPGLKHLIVRACVPKILNAFLSQISCPSLERAYTIMELTNNSTVEVARDLKTASTKLAQLTLQGSHPSPRRPDRIDFGHVYLDDRGNSIQSCAALSQATVAIAARGEGILFVDDSVSTSRLASTAAFVFTVTRPIRDRTVYRTHASDRDTSSVIGPILEGLPRMDITSLTVHFRPGEEIGHEVCVFKDATFLRLLASARRLNWLGDGLHLVQILQQPDSFGQLNYLAIGLPERGGFPVPLEREVEYRKVRARNAVPAGKLRRQAWNAPLLLPEAKENAMHMFDELLDVVGRRVI